MPDWSLEHPSPPKDKEFFENQVKSNRIIDELQEKTTKYSGIIQK